MAWDGLSVQGPKASGYITIPYENIVMWTLHLEETCLDLTLDGTFTCATRAHPPTNESQLLPLPSQLAALGTSRSVVRVQSKRLQLIHGWHSGTSNRLAVLWRRLAPLYRLRC